VHVWKDYLFGGCLSRYNLTYDHPFIYTLMLSTFVLELILQDRWIHSWHRRWLLDRTWYIHWFANLFVYAVL